MTEVSQRMTQLSRRDRALLFERLRQKEREKPPAERQTRGIERRQGSAPPPLSFSQQRLWFIDRLQPGDFAYNIPTVVRITGDLDPGALRRALEAVTERHESLRTTFGMAGAEPVQVIAPRLPVPLPLIDLTGIGSGDPLADPPELRRIFEAETRQPFDLGRGPLLRALLVRMGIGHHVLILVLHHIVSDGWSMAVLVRETGALYQAFAAGTDPVLPELPIQYPDFALWQRTWLQGNVLEEQIGYWRQRLAGAPAALDLPADRPRPAMRSSAGASRKGLELRDALADRLRRLGREAGATPFVVLLGAFQAVLRHHTGEEDLCVGTAVANRNRAETSDLIGFFINSLVLRGDLSGDPTFRELLARLRKVSIEAFSHQDLPFEKLVEELRPERDPSRSPLFQVMLVLQNTPDSSPQAGGLRFDGVLLETKTAKLDLTLSVKEWPEKGFFGKLEYTTALFDATTIARFGAHLTTLLEAALMDPDRRLSELPVLSPAELSQVLAGWNDTRTDFGPRCLHELVEEQVDRTPEAAAVEWEGGRLTYAELEDRAVQLARHLRKLGVKMEEAVGLCAERSPELIAGMLGVLKSGAAWLPLDPAQPEERLAAMAEDGGTRVLLTQEPLLRKFPALAEGRRVICLDTFLWEEVAGESTERFPSGAHPDSLAYVIFTSGSTGRPKGVMVPHRGVCNRLLWAQDAYRLDGRDAVLQKASIGFDFSVWECFAPLVAGARLVLTRPDGHRDAAYLARAIPEHGVTFAHFAPSMLTVFLEQEGVERCAGSLRQVFTGGEALSPELRDRALARLGVSLHNEYGPTEASIDATRSVCDLESLSGRHRVPIGVPISNTRTYVVSRELRPASIGVPGELLIGGDGLARGYAGRPDLTAERFVPDPFGGEAGDRLYRTGDLTRWLAGGELEFLGRIDRQVKVRGIRIEPGEIEAALLALPGVRDAAVLVREDRPGDRRLVAYVAADESETLDADLRRGLRERLPEPMVPAAFVRLEELPVTSAGKVDRRALAAVMPEAGAGPDFSPPRTPEEELLAGLWAEVLGIDASRRPIGRLDNFFDLGGHSLLATQLSSRVREAFALELPLRALFESPTVAGLAEELEKVRESGGLAAPPIRKAPRSGPIPLSFAQQRLWFLDQLEPGTAFYNMPQQPRLLGPLRPAALARALAEVVRRHESLRTTFGDLAGTPFQVVGPAPDANLPLVDVGSLPERARERELARLRLDEVRRPFDLARGPLVRAALVRAGAEDHTVLVTVHHIVSDGWSTRVLIFEMAALYAAFSAGRPSPLPELPIQYADYAAWQREWLRGEALETQLAYWRRRLDRIPGLQLPTDRPRPAVETFRGANRSVSLPESLSSGLQALSRREGATLFMTLLAGFAALLGRWTGQSDIPVGSPIANRHRAEVEGLVGFFANTLVLRADLAGRPTFRELLGRVRTLALEGYAHQEIPFEKLVEELQPERDMSRNPLFQVMLVLQNQPQRTIEAGDVVMTGETADPGTAKFDLTQFWWEVGGRLFGVLEHNTDLFDRSTAARLFAHQEAFLAAAVADPDRPVPVYDLLSEGERHQLVAEWNETADRSEEEDSLPIHQRVGRQAAETPNAVAALFEGRSLTYRELDERANRLARRLIRLGVGPEILVGICVERSIAMGVAMLAVLKAGGAAVALDPAYPIDRLDFILRDARLPVLLTQTPLRERFPDFGGTAILLDTFDGDEDPFPEESGEDPRVEVGLDNPMYAIYTSGSTGQPKGILVTHRAFVNLIDWQRRRSGLVPQARTVQFATFGFCVSFQEIFSSWDSGSSLVLAGEMTRRDIDGLGAFLEAEKVERLHLPFAALKHLAEASVSRTALPDSLREVITAGEQLQVTPAVRSLFERLPGCVLHNQYGASETHVVSALALTGTPEEWPAIPAVGRPISNVRIHLLDSHFEPMPIGVPGELYAGGDCLARGYLNDPVLTAQKLVPDPFAGLWGEPGARLYRTGDQARVLADGRIEYHGRLDGQVKIRGFRVELGEIETTLARHAAVRDAAVLARPALTPGGPPRLVAWVVPQTSGREEALFEELRAHLRAALPDYMVPAAFVAMAALPVNANGKLDQPALPEPDESQSGRRAQLAPPRTPAERALAAIWGEVLGIEKVGIHDSFFELGGHSLLATQLMSRVRDRFGVELPLRALFEEPTVAGLSGRLVRLRSHDGSVQPIRPADQGVGPLPLSFAQERMWFLHQLDPLSPVYNMPAAFRLEGRIAPERLEETLRTVVRRHEALRTTFHLEEGQPRQVVSPEPGRILTEIDLSALPSALREEELKRRAGEEVARPFDLAAGPLLRATFLRLAAGEAALILVQHHIVSDGWSLGVLVREVAAIYGALLAGVPPSLPALPIQYADFAAWQRFWLQGERLEREMSYWKERLGGVPVLRLPADRPRRPVRRFQGGTRHFPVSPALHTAAAELGTKEGATVFMVLLAAFAAVLARHAGQEDFAVGTPVANRNRSEIEGLIGFFLNTLALRTDLSGDPGFRELLRRTRKTTLDAYAHQDLPFEKLVAELQPERDLSQTPIFQAMLVLQNAPMSALEIPGLKLSPLGGGEEGPAQFDLTLTFWEMTEGAVMGGMAGSLRYDLDLLEAATADRLAGHLQILLAGALSSPDDRLSDLPLLSEAERHQLAVEERAIDEPRREACLHDLFAVWAERTPTAPAVTVGEVTWSYGELAQSANGLARGLTALGVGPEVPVAICLERSPELIAAILGVLQAGGAYLPLDPTHPGERLGSVLEDSGAPILLTTAALREGWMERGGCQILEIEKEPSPPSPLPPALTPARERGASAQESLSPPLPGDGSAGGRGGRGVRVLPDNLAYVIYTSGSTGRPKGVGVSHASAARLMRETESWFGFGPQDVWTMFHSFAFDFSVWEIWGALAYGGRLVVVPQDVTRSPEAFHELLARERVTVLNQTPSAFHQLLQTAGGEESLDSLRWVLFGGEALDPRILRPWFDRYGDERPRMVNLYGITETTVHSTFRPLSAEDAAGAAPSGSPVGRAIPDLSLDLFDRRMRPVPLGAAGELYVGGPGLARGYLGRPDLTAERFVPDPFSQRPGERLYRSGDLARRLPDGGLDFLGRADYQVKVRGFRIELGEIEAALRHHPAVRDAAVLALGEGESRQLAAFVASSGTASPADLRSFLKQRLPEVMVPAGFVVLDSLPLTVNGKVDRRALAGMAAGVERSRAEYRAPSGPAEAALAEIWSGLLSVERVGADDDFFALGGHSLLAAQLVSRVRDRLGVELPLRALFEEPGLAALARRVEAERFRGEAAPPLRPAPRQEALPLSFAQERMWFLHQLEPGSPVYHMPVFLRLQGEMRPELLEETLRTVVRRHEVLRTTFRSDGGLPVQVVGPEPERILAEIDLRGLPAERMEAELAVHAAAEAVRPFDLAGSPPLRATLVRLTDDEAALLVNQHHIASDGWSLGVLVREVAAIYGGLLAGRGPALPDLPVQYADYAVWQRGWLQGERLARELGSWRERLADVPVLRLPTDRPRAAVATTHGGGRGLFLPADVAAGVRELGRSAGTTLFMTALAGFYALLGRYSGQDDLAVGTVSANRDRSEIEGLIGFFVNTLVLRTGLGGDPNFTELLERTRRTTLDGFTHRELPFEKLVAELRPERDLSHTPLFQVMLVLQNAPVGALEVPGLRLSPLSEGGERSVQFELTFNVREVEGGIAVTIEYNRDLFDAATVDRMGAHFGRLLAGAAAGPARRLSELPMLSEEELGQVLGEWSGMLGPAPGDQSPGYGVERPMNGAFKPDSSGASPSPGIDARAGLCLHHLFAEQAARMPEAPAVESAGRSLTYGELAADANRLARHLRRLGVGAEDRVGLATGRTPEMVTGMLAVLQAGGAYVPLDPSYPVERLDWMLADAGVSVLLTEAGLADGWPAVASGQVRPVLLDEAGAAWREESLEPLDGPGPDPGNAAYTLYTSGSTGTPKGVVVEHRSIAAYALEARDAYGLRAGERVLQFASISFDISAEEIFATLAAGACLVLRPEDMAGSAAHFFGEVERLGVAMIDLPTAYWHELVSGLEKEDVELPACLRLVVIGGEEARADRLAVWQARVDPAVRLVNTYGPTEATIVATRIDLEESLERAPIGRPIRGARAFVADRAFHPVPPGVPGELLVGGSGVARGYLGRPELTAERFVPDPWSGVPGARLYRTGDGVRWRDGGTLDFLGRIDGQVKIRGFRIEPGEIEAALLRQPGIAAAVVAVHPAEHASLVAYVVSPGAPVSVEDLRRSLAAELPAFLVPAAFVFLEALPLTPGGKLDRRRLPAPGRAEAAAFVPPSTDTERELAALWAEVLGVERVGTGDSFFDLGGHSLLLPRVQAGVRERLSRDLPLLKLFEHPTPGALAAYLDGLLERGGEPQEEALGEVHRDRAQRQRQGLELQRQRMAGRRRT